MYTHTHKEYAPPKKVFVASDLPHVCTEATWTLEMIIGRVIHYFLRATRYKVHVSLLLAISHKSQTLIQRAHGLKSSFSNPFSIFGMYIGPLADTLLVVVVVFFNLLN